MHGRIMVFQQKKNYPNPQLDLEPCKFIASIVSLFLFGMKELEYRVGKARCSCIEGIWYVDPAKTDLDSHLNLEPCKKRRFCSLAVFVQKEKVGIQSWRRQLYVL